MEAVFCKGVVTNRVLCLQVVSSKIVTATVITGRQPQHTLRKAEWLETILLGSEQCSTISHLYSDPLRATRPQQLVHNSRTLS